MLVRMDLWLCCLRIDEMCGEQNSDLSTPSCVYVYLLYITSTTYKPRDSHTFQLATTKCSVQTNQTQQAELH